MLVLLASVVTKETSYNKDKILIAMHRWWIKKMWGKAFRRTLFRRHCSNHYLMTLLLAIRQHGIVVVIKYANHHLSKRQGDQRKQIKWVPTIVPVLSVVAMHHKDQICDQTPLLIAKRQPFWAEFLWTPYRFKSSPFGKSFSSAFWFLQTTFHGDPKSKTFYCDAPGGNRHL